MYELQNWIPIIVMALIWLFIVRTGSRQRKKAAEIANEFTDKALKENDKNITELKEIKELLKEINWYLKHK